MMLQSTLLDGRRAHPIVAVPSNPNFAPGLFTCGLGIAGLGLEHLDPARPWSLLAIPIIVLLGLLCLREAVRGKESVLMRQAAGNWERFWIRVGAWMFGLLGWPIIVLWAVGVMELD
jgi:hypothetical protein